MPKEADSRADIRVEYFELIQALEKSIQNLYQEWVTPVNETVRVFGRRVACWGSPPF